MSFPLTVAADCWSAVLETAYGTDLLGTDPVARCGVGALRKKSMLRSMPQRTDPLAMQTNPWSRVADRQAALIAVPIVARLAMLCWAGCRAADKGFRTAPLIRIVGAEDGLLALTGDGPRMFVNLEDYLYYNTGRFPNQRFRAIMAVFTGDERCTARHDGCRLPLNCAAACT